MPIELVQAMRARATALDSHTSAVTNYNRAQIRLVQATGTVPQTNTAAPMAGPTVDQ